MRKNFEIGLSIELVQGGRVYDLHNCYYFSGIVIGSEQSVEIAFDPDRVHGIESPPLIIRFDAVDYLELSPGFGVRDTRDLDEVGYKNPDDRDDEWLQSEFQSDRGDHLFFRVGSDDFIRIHSQRACLFTQPKPTANATLA
jgi:hypothetical protein